MAIVVQKYGGSSVADVTRLRQVADRVMRTRGEGHDVVVVVSAMGDTTDELLALAKQVLAYALLVRPSGARGYRAHFERMGYESQLDQLEAKRAAGASEDDLAHAVSDEMLSALGYAGPAAGAAAAFMTLSAGLDVAIVRVLAARPGDVEGVRATMRAALSGQV